jgi:DNA-binding NtrC family response regulator
LTGSILIIDDELRLGRALRSVLEIDGHQVQYTADPQRGLELLKQHPFDVLLTDLVMPKMGGIEVLRRAKRIRPSCEVVLMTAFASVETAREALKQGAVDYITKPFSAEQDLKPLIRDILEAAESEVAEAGEAPDRPERTGDASPLDKIVGRGPAIREILGKLPRIARSDATVLLRGESGTGKEVFAEALHQLSRRCDEPMIRVNCAAIPETLMESELFGAAKGAYTGADQDRIGLFQAADGGTIFFDEIGEFPTTIQAKLLRVLQEGEFYRIGDSRRLFKVDVRVIAATNRDLDEAVHTGELRHDLYYRLNVVPIVLPPLRERPEDLMELIDHFAKAFHKGKHPRFSPEALAAMESYDWPGNVRELENAVEHALVLGDPTDLQLNDLPVAIQHSQRRRAAPALAEGRDPGTLEEIEIRCIFQAMMKTGFNRTRAARLLGITRRTLGYRIHKYGLDEDLDDLREQEASRENRGPAKVGPSPRRSPADRAS